MPRKGQKQSKAARAKMRAAWKTRAPISESTRRKMSVAHTGKRHTKSTLARMSLWHKNKPPVSTATAQKMSASAKRRCLSPQPWHSPDAIARRAATRRGQPTPWFSRTDVVAKRAQAIADRRAMKFLRPILRLQRRLGAKAPLLSVMSNGMSPRDSIAKLARYYRRLRRG